MYESVFTEEKGLYGRKAFTEEKGG